MRKVITFGTYDVFHVGHIRLFKRAKELGDWLTIGISSDQLNIIKKGRAPIYNYESRKEIVESLKFTDEVFMEESLDKKRHYIQHYNADLLVMGNDWEGKFDYLKDICEVLYLPRTPSVSTTEIIEVIRDASTSVGQVNDNL